MKAMLLCCFLRGFSIIKAVSEQRGDIYGFSIKLGYQIILISKGEFVSKEDISFSIQVKTLVIRSAFTVLQSCQPRQHCHDNHACGCLRRL